MWQEYTELVNYLTRKSFSPFSQEAPCRQGGTVNGKSLWRVTTDARERWRIIKCGGPAGLEPATKLL
jgi:hypothetical protein